MRVRLAHAAIAMIALWGCESAPERERCERCGMYADLDPGFAASLGETHYDTPKCLWADLLDAQGQGADQARVTEYYSREPMPASQATYVVGSDILGPMGTDLIPLSNADDAERFAREHGGRVVAASAIDRALLKSLAP